MLDHIAIQVRDIGAATAFYDAVFAPLGYRRLMDFGGVIGYGEDAPSFWVGVAEAAGPGLPPHIAFQAADRAAVLAFFEAAKATGAEVLHEPFRRVRARPRRQQRRSLLPPPRVGGRASPRSSRSP